MTPQVSVALPARRLVAALLLGWLPAAAAVAEDLPENVFAPALGDEIQDVVFLADARPVFLRFHLRVEGNSFRTAWADFAGRLHRFLDGDGDGVLTLQEAQRGNWQALLQNPFGNRQPLAAGNARPTSLDANPKDGKVSVDELASYLRTTLGFGAFGVQPGTPPDAKAQAIFAHLDIDHDGMLSPAELASTDACFDKLDLDEDELISVAEMRPFENAYADRFRPVTIPAINAAEADNSTVVVLGPEAASPRIVQRLLGKYDRGGKKDGRLGAAELGIAPETFRRFDADGDGGLGAAELTALLGQPPPDLEFNVALGPVGRANAKIEMIGTSRLPLSSAPASATRATPRGAASPLRLELEGAEVEFLIEDNINNNRNVYNQQFSNADSDKNGYVDKTESMQNGFLQQIFQAADRDGDGKLFKKELEAYVDRQTEAIASRMMLTITDRGRALFEILDVDGDQKLGVRELRRARARLSALDRDGDGRIAQDEIPRRYRFGVGRGQAPVRRGFTIEAYDSPDPPGRKKGPPWFEKMDRNRDGDVSLREFLGPRDDFRRFDSDGDGLIDPQEAAKAP